MPHFRNLISFLKNRFKHMNKKLTPFLIPLALLNLSACSVQDIYGISAIPRGYAHTHKEYKTIIPDRPYFIGESYTDEEAILSQELWSKGVNELINELENNAFMNGLSISLQPTAPNNSFDVRMDYYLRKALKERGYLIVTEPLDTVPVLKYTARLPGYQHMSHQKGRAIDNIDDIQNEFDIVEDAYNDGQPYVFMGLEVYDLSAAPANQLLLEVETLQNVLDKDIREIRGALVDPPISYGYSEDSNLNK